MTILFDERYRGEMVWRAVLDAMNDVVSSTGLKQAAYDLDAQPSALSHALSERDGHRPKAEWLARLVIKEGGERILEVLADACGYELQRKRELTPQEKLDKLNAVLDANPDIASVVRKKAGV